MLQTLFLATGFSCALCMRSPQLLSEIEGTTAFDVFSIARRGVEQEYTQVLSELCPELASKFSMDSYKKVWALINSRILTLPERLGRKARADRSFLFAFPSFTQLRFTMPDPSQG